MFIGRREINNSIGEEKAPKEEEEGRSSSSDHLLLLGLELEVVGTRKAGSTGQTLHYVSCLTPNSNRKELYLDPLHLRRFKKINSRDNGGLSFEFRDDFAMKNPQENFCLCRKCLWLRRFR